MLLLLTSNGRITTINISLLKIQEEDREVEQQSHQGYYLPLSHNFFFIISTDQHSLWQHDAPSTPFHTTELTQITVPFEKDRLG